MASYRIPAIDRFYFSKSGCAGSEGLSTSERHPTSRASLHAAIQVSTLVYWMGDKAEDLLQSFALSEADAKKYDTVKGKFQDFFVKRGNTI